MEATAPTVCFARDAVRFAIELGDSGAGIPGQSGGPGAFPHTPLRVAAGALGGTGDFSARVC